MGFNGVIVITYNPTYRGDITSLIPSSKLTWQWKSTSSNRKYIFKWWIFQPAMLVYPRVTGRGPTLKKLVELCFLPPTCDWLCGPTFARVDRNWKLSRSFLEKMCPKNIPKTQPQKVFGSLGCVLRPWFFALLPLEWLLKRRFCGCIWFQHAFCWKVVIWVAILVPLIPL